MPRSARLLRVWTHWRRRTTGTLFAGSNGRFRNCRLLWVTSPNLMTIMPARLAATDPNKQVSELVGSGPFRFVANEFSAGALAVLARFEAYQPRDEPANGSEKAVLGVTF
jgi:hypothetical protein